MGSFLNEHSIELLMVPKLIDKLSEFYSQIIPIYFWGNREGSGLAKRNLKDIPLRIVAFYARRPKTVKKNNCYIECKINCELIQKAQILKECRIPSLAGLPLINTLIHFQKEVKFLWFNINNFKTETVVRIPIQNENQEKISGTLDYNEMINVIQSTRSIAWDEAVSKFIEINRLFDQGPKLRYKPIYLLIPSVD